MTQLDLFYNENDVEFLKDEIRRLHISQMKCRKKQFAMITDLSRMCIELKQELDKIREKNFNLLEMVS